MLYLLGLQLLSPGTTQLLIQIAPILLLLGSLLVFREAFDSWQALGLAVLLGGFALFFNQRLAELFGALGDYSLGAVAGAAGGAGLGFLRAGAEAAAQRLELAAES